MLPFFCTKLIPAQSEAQHEKERQRARINSQKSGKEDRKRMAIAQGKKGGKIVLNTEQCSELNQVSGRERA